MTNGFVAVPDHDSQILTKTEELGSGRGSWGYFSGEYLMPNYHWDMSTETHVHSTCRIDEYMPN